MPEKGKEKWFGLGKEWKKEIGTYGKEKAKEREEFYGKHTILRLKKVFLKDEKSEDVDEIIAKLKALEKEKALTSNETIKAKKREEKVGKNRILSAILRDFFQKECASKNPKADVFVALKYLKDFGNVDFVMAGETVKIENGILEILDGAGKARVRGYLIPAGELKSPPPVVQRGGPEKKIVVEKKPGIPPEVPAKPPEKVEEKKAEPVEEPPSEPPTPVSEVEALPPEKPIPPSPRPPALPPEEIAVPAEKLPSPPLVPLEEAPSPLPPRVTEAEVPPPEEEPSVIPAPVILPEITSEEQKALEEFEQKMDEMHISKALRKRIVNDPDSPSQFSYQKQTKNKEKYHIIGTDDIAQQPNEIIAEAPSFYLLMKIKASNYEKAEQPQEAQKKTYADLEIYATFEVNKKIPPKKLDQDIDKAILSTSRELYEKGKTAKSLIDSFKFIEKPEHLALGPGTTLFYDRNPEEADAAKQQKYQIIVYPGNKIRIQIQDPNNPDQPKHTGIINLAKKDEITPERFTKRIKKIEQFLEWKGIITPNFEVKIERQPNGTINLTFNDKLIGYLLPIDPDTPEKYKLLNSRKKQIGVYDSLQNAETGIREKLLYPLIKQEILNNITGFVLTKGEDTETYGIIEIRKNKKDRFAIGQISIEKNPPISFKITRFRELPEMVPLVTMAGKELPLEIPAPEIISEEAYTYITTSDLQKKLNEIFIEAEAKEKTTAEQLKSKLETKYPEFKVIFLEKIGDVYKLSLSRNGITDYFFEINPNTNIFTLLNTENKAVKNQQGDVLQNLLLDKLPFITVISPMVAPICSSLPPTE